MNISREVQLQNSSCKVTDEKSSWHKPSITLIDLKRTLASGGSGADSQNSALP